MSNSKLKKLKAAGWKIGTAETFLGLTEQEAALVEVKLSLIGALRKCRLKHRISQTALAQRLGSSQSRVAKIEAGDPTVSLDLIVRALFAAGATPQDMRKAFSPQA